MTDTSLHARSEPSSVAALLRRAAVLGCTRLPTPFLRVLPPMIGAVFWALQPGHRRGVRENLRRIHGRVAPGAELRTFVAFAQSFAEGLAVLGPRAADVDVDVEGEAYFRELSEARGAQRREPSPPGAFGGEAPPRDARGCIFVTAHMSSFEVAGVGLHRALGTEVVMAMRAEPDAGARAASDAIRAHAGLRVVHIGDDPLAALPLVGHLRRGAAVGLQIDRLPPGVRGIPVTLFGRQTTFPVGPFVLARATGAPILPVFTRRTGFLRARVRAHAPLFVAKRAREAELAEVAQVVARHLEDWIREAPAEWLDWGEDAASGA